MNAIFPSSSFQVRQLAQYGRTDAAIPGTVTLMQMGEAGTPYASILVRDLVTSALAGSGDLNLSASLGSINFLFDQGAGAVTLSVVQGELQVSPSLRTSKVDAAFVNAAAVTVNGSPVVTQAQLAAVPSVTSFNQRTGDVLLEEADILRAGGAPQANPTFSGWVVAPSFWDTRIADDTVVTANWVHRLLCEGGVASFNGRHGNVTLTTADVNAAYSVPGPPFPSAPSPVIGDASDRIATTAFVDDTLEDYAPLVSPHLTGIPTAPTPLVSDNSNTVATTAFVNEAIGSNYHALGYVNIKDFGAKGDGVTNDAAAFNAFNTWVRTQTTPVVLFIPPGIYAGLDNYYGAGCDFFVGAKDLTVFAYGATLPGLFGTRGLSYYQLGTHTPLTLWAQIQTVSSGSNTVTCITPAQASQFAVGNWVCVSSLEMQGATFPPNWYYYDYVQITAINVSTGVITFDGYLNFTHKATYPDTAVSSFASGGGAYPGQLGGPASVFALAPEWDCSIRIYGMTVNSTLVPSGGHAGVVLSARRFVCVDCTFVGSMGPSTSLFSEFHNCTFVSGGSSNYYIEVDKNISHLKFINCRINQLSIQSASADIIVDGCQITTLVGNARVMVLRNSYISNQPTFSPPLVGANKTTIIENCNIANFYTTNTYNYLPLSNLTFNNGTFSILLTNSQILNAYRIAIPGSKCFFQNNYFIYNFGNPFIILNVYQDSTNLYFDTTLTALPSFSGTWTNASTAICQHPAPRLTATDNTGNDTALMTGKGTKEYPIYSYAHKVYCEDLIQSGTTAVTQAVMQWGTLVSLKINVIRADTGANGILTIQPLGKNGSWCVNPSNATMTYNPIINLKTAGVRTVTPAAVTGNVAGDTITVPGAIWFMQYGLNPYMSANIAADTPAQHAIVEIELVTDQGITALEYTVQ